MPSKVGSRRARWSRILLAPSFPIATWASAPALECIHLGIEFGGLKAVDDFSLTIGKTEIAGLSAPTVPEDHGLQPAHQGVPAHARHHPA